MSKRLQLDIWSDIACPWCYVGKRRLEAALARFPHRDAVDVTWRSFELDPAAPKTTPAGEKLAGRLAKKYGVPLAQAEGMMAKMTATAQADGLDLHFEKARSSNTFDAHRLVHFAAAHGKQGEMKERLFRAYMTEGEPLGERETLVRLAGEVGLDAAAVRAMLETNAHGAEVRSDEEAARELGISGVPFFVFARRFGVSGAQSADVLLEVLEKSWGELFAEAPAVAEGAACGPDGCV